MKTVRNLEAILIGLTNELIQVDNSLSVAKATPKKKVGSKPTFVKELRARRSALEFQISMFYFMLCK